jgi:hypothetical protein
LQSRIVTTETKQSVECVLDVSDIPATGAYDEIHDRCVFPHGLLIQDVEDFGKFSDSSKPGIAKHQLGIFSFPAGIADPQLGSFVFGIFSFTFKAELGLGVRAPVWRTS